MEVYILILIVAPVLGLLIVEFYELWTHKLTSKESSEFILYFWQKLEWWGICPETWVKCFDQEKELDYYRKIKTLSNLERYQLKASESKEYYVSLFMVRVSYKILKQVARSQNLRATENINGLVLLT